MLEYISMGSTCTLSACKAINKCRIGGGNFILINIKCARERIRKSYERSLGSGNACLTTQLPVHNHTHLYKYFVNMAKKRIKVATFARAQSTMGQASDWICNDINRCWLISENCKIQHNIK